jgi:hypothetical protein
MPADEELPPSSEQRIELASVALTILDAPDLQATESDRFFGQVRAIAERRARAGWPGEMNDASMAVFVRAAYPRSAAAGLENATPCADLADTLGPILGRVHVLNFDASQGRAAPLVNSNPGEVLEWLAEQTFGSSQIIMLYRETLMLVERSTGADGVATRKESVRLEAADVTQDELIKALDAFHLCEVLTPLMCPSGVWRPAHAQRYHPGQYPEKAIQYQLRGCLAGWWRGHVRAECEDSIGIGRIDVRLLRPDPVDGALAYWCIIELKVVKSYRYVEEGTPAPVTDLENAQAVAEGVEQASDFARNRRVFGVLEIYDMRKDKMPDPREHALVVRALSEHKPNPLMRLTPIFGTSHDARHCGYA